MISSRLVFSLSSPIFSSLPSNSNLGKISSLNHFVYENRFLRKFSNETETFSHSQLHPFLLNTLEQLQIKELFPVQKATFNPIYQGNDLVVKALTGSGKTFAFTLPIVQRLVEKRSRPSSNSPPVLILAPTRELAIQIHSQFEHFSPTILSHAFYGGVSYTPQIKNLNKGIHVAIGTPGRLLDFLKQGDLSLKNVEVVVLDEVDRMLEIGLGETVDSILSYPKPENVQTLFFSATIPPWVKRHQTTYLRNAQVIDLVGQDHKTPTNVKHVALQHQSSGASSSIQVILQRFSSERTIIFTSTKLEASDLTNQLVASGIAANQIHGDIVQVQRESALKAFRSGACSVLVATDVAARGLDIPEVDLVIQCSFPRTSEDYIHRSGRSGRAGRPGTSVLLYKPIQSRQLRSLASEIGVNFEMISGLTQNWETILENKLEKLTPVLPIFYELVEKNSEKIQEVLPQMLASFCGYSPYSHVSLIDGTPERITLSIQSEKKIPVTQKRLEDFLLSTNQETLPSFTQCQYSGNLCYADFPVQLGLKLLNLSNDQMTFSILEKMPDYYPVSRRGGESFRDRRPRENRDFRKSSRDEFGRRPPNEPRYDRDRHASNFNSSRYSFKPRDGFDNSFKPKRDRYNSNFTSSFRDDRNSSPRKNSSRVFSQGNDDESFRKIFEKLKE